MALRTVSCVALMTVFSLITPPSAMGDKGYLLLEEIPRERLQLIADQTKVENSFSQKSQINVHRYSGRFLEYKDYDILWGDRKANDKEACQEVANAFLEKNKESLAVPPDDLRWLNYEWDDSIRTLIVSRPKEYYPGINTFSEAPQYQIRLVFRFNNNQMGEFSDQTGYIPMGFDGDEIEETISLTPNILPLSDEMREVLARIELTFHGADGKLISVGNIKPKDVIGVVRRVSGFENDSKLHIGLAWKFEIYKNDDPENSSGLGFTVWVSAITGEVLKISPNFNT